MDKPSAIGLIIGFVSYMVWFLGCDQREPQTRPVRATRLMSLHESALRGDDPAIFRAAGLNPDLDGRDGDGRTPLMLAAIYDRKIFAEHLISMGADLEAADPDGRTALHLAVLNDSDVFDLLVSRGARTDAVDHAGETPLH